MTLEEAKRHKSVSSVIYLITNLSNGKGYVGSTNMFYKRLGQHLSHLRSGAHHSLYLQRAFNKYGEHAFSVTILESCPVNKLIEIEQGYLDAGEYYERDKGYNVRKEADRPNELSPEQKEKLGKRLRESIRENAKTRVILNPSGERIEFTIIKDLCTEHGLSPKGIGDVLNDRTGQYRGWRLPRELLDVKFLDKGKGYQFITPTGYVEKIYNIRKYCTEHGLSEPAMSLVCAGKQKEHRGYLAINHETIRSKRLPMKSFRLRAPSGETLECTGIKATAKKLGIDRKGLKRVLSGEQEAVKGYSLG